MPRPQIRLGALDLSGVDADGVRWVTDTLDGWMGSPASSLSLTQKPRAPGAWVGPRQLTAKVINASGVIIAPSSAALQAAVDRLTVAASLDATRLAVTEDGKTRFCTVYRQDEVLVPRGSSARQSPFSVQLVAADPRKFGDEITESTALPSVTGGLEIPFTIPFVLGATVASGDIALTNEGIATGPIVVRIDGPVTRPTITHINAAGASKVVALSLTIAAGDWVVIDMEAETVLANGVTPRDRYLIRQEWFGFDPGVNSFSFAAESTDPDALLTVTGTPAW